MFTSPQDAVPATPFALILVAATALLAPDLDQYRSGIATQESATCNACGAVEMVREIGFRAESAGHARASESVRLSHARTVVSSPRGIRGMAPPPR